MKKLFLIGVCNLVLLPAVFAQTQKGNWLVGGNAGFTSQKQDDFKTTTITFNPNAGYFVMDDLAIGANVQLSSIKDDDDDAVTTVALGPFVRYYFVDIGPKAKLFANGSFGFGSIKYNESQSFTQWDISAGPAFFLNPHTALEVVVGYGSQKFKDFEAANSFGLRIGFQIHLGSGGSSSSE
ncbi:MAG: hypothetical protein EOO13_13155 [Chitinophagaceae bacterium]|nr:MAG: hypothetical protein EOO13_13155 [Chitinophagaceae bacterium]